MHPGYVIKLVLVQFWCEYFVVAVLLLALLTSLGNLNRVFVPLQKPIATYNMCIK